MNVTDIYAEHALMFSCFSSPSPVDESGSGQPDGMDMVVCRAPGGEFYVEGETWNLDECTRCTCRKGRVLCDSEVCPPALCQTPIKNKDTCCHVCPGNSKKGARLVCRDLSGFMGKKQSCCFGCSTSMRFWKDLHVALRWAVLCQAHRLIKKPAETGWVYILILQAGSSTCAPLSPHWGFIYPSLTAGRDRISLNLCYGNILWHKYEPHKLKSLIRSETYRQHSQA